MVGLNFYDNDYDLEYGNDIYDRNARIGIKEGPKGYIEMDMPAHKYFLEQIGFKKYKSGLSSAISRSTDSLNSYISAARRCASTGTLKQQYKR